MQSALIPKNEEQRLSRLREYNILDSPTEQDYDDITLLVSQICGTSISTISFVDRDRQWFKAAIGVRERETSRDVAFCAHTILGDDIFTVRDASSDPRFEDNPLVTIDPQLKFYAGMPLLTPDGYRLGALCAIDRVPRTLSPEQEDSLRILARHVMNLLELRRSRRLLEEQNRELADISDLKSRLMSIIAHDLRSPIASITSVVSLFSEHDLEEGEQEEVLEELGKLLDSTRYLLDNLIGWASRSLETTRFEFTEIDLDRFARELAESIQHDVARKGNTLVVEVHPPAAEGTPATEAEAGARPGSSAPMTVKPPTVTTDRNLLVFVVRNLVANANKFTSEGTIRLQVQRDEGLATIRVVDTGVGMTQELQEKLFDWGTRTRNTGTAGEKGAGLALLFCHDFVERIGGSISVESTPGEGTTMTVIVPDGAV
jgi:signal transduction histidine kinase